MTRDEALAMAAELADAQPDRYRNAAYQVLLSNFLIEADNLSTEKNPNKQNAPKRKPPKKEAGPPEAHQVAARGNRTQQAGWAASHLADRGEKVSPSAVRAEIKAALGIKPQNVANTSTALKSLTPKYLSREKDGRGFSYVPTARMLELFADLGSED